MKRALIIVLALASFIILTSCTQDINSDTYSLDSVGDAQVVKYGTILDAKKVTVKADGSVGTIVGAGMGAIAGSAIGGTTRANLAGGLGGAVLGGLLGYAIQDSINTQDAMLYIVKLSDGTTLSIVQGLKDPLQVQQCVTLLIGAGDRARLLPDPDCQAKKQPTPSPATAPTAETTTVTTTIVKQNTV